MKVLLKQQIILETWTPYTFISSVRPTDLLCARCVCHGVERRAEDRFQESLLPLHPVSPNKEGNSVC